MGNPEQVRPRRPLARRRPTVIRALAALGALALLGGACGDSPTEPPTAAIEGAWSLALEVGEIDSTPELGDAECQIGDAAVEIDGEGSAFTGSVDGTITCAYIGENVEEPLFGDRITSGTLAGDAVSFEIGTWEFTGTIDGDSMHGEVAIDIVVEGEPTVLDGTWSAERS